MTTEVKELIGGLTAPSNLLDVQQDMRSLAKINRFIEYIYSHHPALFEHAYKEASKWLK